MASDKELNMARIRICPAAQKMMDKLYDDGFVVQSIGNYSCRKRTWTTDVTFIAEEADRRGQLSDYYEGWGTTLLKAIHQAVKAGLK